mgnify:CR=1 FL=1
MPNLPQEIAEEFSWSGSAKGWITDHIFEQIVLTVLIPKIQQWWQRFGLEGSKSILIIDNHGSRANPRLLERLRQENIDLLIIPAYSSHILQPLDNGIFA